MTNSDSWLQYVAPKLAGNGFKPMKSEAYQPQGYKYAVQKSGFYPSKFGMAEHFFTFAEIPDLTPQTMKQYSAAAFKLANANKQIPLPNGLFNAVFCFTVAITENLTQEAADFVRATAPENHWSAFEIPVVMDLSSRSMVYFEKTPLWGAAYFAGFRRMIEANLR